VTGDFFTAWILSHFTWYEISVWSQGDKRLDPIARLVGLVHGKTSQKGLAAISWAPCGSAGPGLKPSGVIASPD